MSAKALPRADRPRRRVAPLTEVQKIDALIADAREHHRYLRNEGGWGVDKNTAAFARELSWRRRLVELGVWTTKEAVADLQPGLLRNRFVEEALRFASEGPSEGS